MMLLFSSFFKTFNFFEAKGSQTLILFSETLLYNSFLSLLSLIQENLRKLP